ncbi:MAG TPA: AmmeMemoRadiSam system protein A [Chromatiales bacterium]|nr:AmmeMemoRadiSam system protein A [Chromatiales bacterium]HEX22747.1 AmmeMemoRadiSam system protein A [Chromatiales bacterium]
MSSANPHNSSKNGLCEEECSLLHKVARASIEHGIETGRPLTVDIARYPHPLREPRATFVTLNEHGQLRGCIGSLEAVRPLVEDVAHNAYAAAFSDPRFPPLQASELADLDVHISVLSPATPMQFHSEEDLIRQLRPGVDGLILEDGYHRGTFLPAVWESLPDPHDFLQHLKLKAGLPADYWSDTIRVSRYTTESF